MSEFAFDRVLKLTHGIGNGVDKACLMMASNMLIGRKEDGDKNGCVCPVITAFIIPTNDAIPEYLLGELYGPLLYEILGTRTDDFQVMARRAYVFTDWSFRTAWPIYLRALGCEKEAAALESLDEIVDAKTAALAALAALADRFRSAHEKICRSCPGVIRRAAAIGDRRPVETCMTLPELVEALR